MQHIANECTYTCICHRACDLYLEAGNSLDVVRKDIQARASQVSYSLHISSEIWCEALDQDFRPAAHDVMCL